MQPQYLLLLLYLLLFYGLLFGWRSWLLWRRTRINPFTFGNTDDAHDWNGRLFKVIAALVPLSAAVAAFGGRINDYLLPLWYLDRPAVHLCGWVLMILALGWTLAAQLQMADSWRIGIDTEHPTQLVTRGLFARSRNPIFLGLLLAYLGFFLDLPNALTLLLAGLAYVSVQIQVRLEEAYLGRLHGGAYAAYCGRVGRWLTF